jgi:hypothetical protein
LFLKKIAHLSGIFLNVAKILIITLAHGRIVQLRHALAAWSAGIFSACGVTGREIESRQGIQV